jgi:hypothetical protein
VLHPTPHRCFELSRVVAICIASTLVATAGAAQAQEAGVLYSDADATAPWLSLGAGVGSYADAASTQALVRVQGAWWLSPVLSLDVTGTVYPMLAPSLGPTYHLSLSGEELTDRHDLLFGLGAGAFTTSPTPTGGSAASRLGGIDPIVLVSGGYGYLGDDVDVRVTATVSRGLRAFEANDFTATLSVSVGWLIRSIRPGA